jgi:hypothetical protein
LDLIEFGAGVRSWNLRLSCDGGQMRPRMSGAGSWIAWTRTRDAGAFVVVLIMTLVTATEAASDAVESKTLTFRYSRVEEYEQLAWKWA